MKDSQKPKGPWMHRFFVFLFSLLFGFLFYWLLGFVIRDLGSLPGPSYEKVEARFVPESMKQAAVTLDRQLTGIQRNIGNQQQRQSILRDSTNSSQQTMNQLLGIQRLSLEKGLPLSESEQKALDESKQLFLANQKQYQTLNEDIARLQEEERTLLERKRGTEESLEHQREPARWEFQRLEKRHNLKLAALKLVVLIPLLLVVLVLFLKKRASIYVPFIYASGAALLAKIVLVIHEHFPTRYFKYILLLALLIAVAKILIYLLRAMAFPKKDWLLKQYREAYERFLCPVCSFPIRRGPLRFMFWNRRTIEKLKSREVGAVELDECYTCPSCGTPLFEKCESCKATRHSLMPACDKCGALKEWSVLKVSAP